MALAKRRKAKAAKDKEGKLSPMVVKPAMSKLRTGSAPKRKKGGKTLMDLAERRRPAAKKPASSQSSKFGSRIPVGSRSSKTAAQSKPKAAPRGTRTPAQRAAAKEKLLAEQKKARAAGNKKSLTRFIPQMSVKKADKVGSGLRLGGEVGLAAAALAGSGGAAAPALGATRGGRLALSGLNKAKSGLSKLFKRKPAGSGRTAKPSTGTPTKPSGSGSASGGKKPSGSGSRTTNRQSTPKRETPAARNKRKDARAERKERLDSGGTRVKSQKRNATLTRGRKTQAKKRADRQKRKNYNL